MIMDFMIQILVFGKRCSHWAIPLGLWKLEEPCILTLRQKYRCRKVWSEQLYPNPGLIKGFINNGDSVKHGRTFCGAAFD